ncbi:hypothetical protein DXB05_14080 [Clostridium sp. OF13-4]|nr:hypothetical protein DXB05_14080 [Clostridium sp. OF13-4]
MGDFDDRTPVLSESLLGYHPCGTGFLTNLRDPEVGQCQVGSLTGAVAPKGYRRRSKVPSEWLETIQRVQRQKGA